MKQLLKFFSISFLVLPTSAISETLLFACERTSSVREGKTMANSAFELNVSIDLETGNVETETVVVISGKIERFPKPLSIVWSDGNAVQAVNRFEQPSGLMELLWIDRREGKFVSLRMYDFDVAPLVDRGSCVEKPA